MINILFKAANLMDAKSVQAKARIAKLRRVIVNRKQSVQESEGSLNDALQIKTKQLLVASRDKLMPLRKQARLDSSYSSQTEDLANKSHNAFYMGSAGQRKKMKRSSYKTISISHSQIDCAKMTYFNTSLLQHAKSHKQHFKRLAKHETSRTMRDTEQTDWYVNRSLVASKDVSSLDLLDVSHKPETRRFSRLLRASLKNRRIAQRSSWGKKAGANDYQSYGTEKMGDLAKKKRRSVMSVSVGEMKESTFSQVLLSLPAPPVLPSFPAKKTSDWVKNRLSQLLMISFDKGEKNGRENYRRCNRRNSEMSASVKDRIQITGSIIPLGVEHKRIKETLKKLMSVRKNPVNDLAQEKKTVFAVEAFPVTIKLPSVVKITAEYKN